MNKREAMASRLKLAENDQKAFLRAKREQENK